MGSLATQCCHLGRHADALAMGETTLEFHRRQLPANDPRIGEGSFESYVLVTVWCFERMACVFR